METLDFGGPARGGIAAPGGGPCGQPIINQYVVPRFSLEGSGPGGIRSV